jgi:hypothetical protein
MPTKLDGLGWLLIILVVVVLASRLIQWLSEALSFLVADECPEPECGGHLRFIDDRRVEGEKFAVWACTRCEYEVLRGVQGQDIVRSTDPEMTP